MAIGQLPFVGCCERFRGLREKCGFVRRSKDAHAHIQKQFIAHKCKRLDASKNAVRIVSEGAESH